MELFQVNNKAKLKLDTVQDRISAYMIGELEDNDLSGEDHKLVKRWTQIWGFLNNYHSPLQAVEAHLRMCQNNGEEISRRTAYRDLRNATDLWADASQISKRAQLILLHEFAMKTFQLAAKSHNYGEMNKALSHLVKIAGQTEEHFGHDFEGHTYILELHTSSGESRTINLDNLHEMSHTDYHQIIEAVEEDEIDVVHMRALLSGDEKAD